MEPQAQLFLETTEPVGEWLIGGVDNGLDGAIVFLGPGMAARPIKIVMPTLRIKTAKGHKRVHNEVALCAIFRRYNPQHVVVEQVTARPDQHVVATMNTGIGHGIIRGILVALQIPYTVVHPRTWQAAMFRGLEADADAKGKALIICHRLWPGVEWTASERSTRNHDGICDATLMAEWGRRQMTGK